MKKMALSMLALILALTYLLNPMNTKTVEASGDIYTPPNSHTVVSLTEETINIADKYIAFQTEPVVQYVITDQLKLRKELSADEFQNVKNQIAEMNLMLKDTTKEHLDNSKIDSEGITFYEDSQKSLDMKMASSTGINAFEVNWWGYNVYLNNHWTKTTYQMIYAGAGGAALYAKIAPMFTAPTAIVKATLYVVAAAGAGLATLMQSENKGKGIRIRFTDVGIPVWTGVFGQ